MMNSSSESTISLAQKLIKIESTYDKPENLSEALDIAIGELSDFSIEIFEKNGATDGKVLSVVKFI